MRYVFLLAGLAACVGGGVVAARHPDAEGVLHAQFALGCCCGALLFLAAWLFTLKETERDP